MIFNIAFFNIAFTSRNKNIQFFKYCVYVAGVIKSYKLYKNFKWLIITKKRLWHSRFLVKTVVFSGIRSEITTLNGEKELLYEKNYARIGVNTDDNLPLNKPLKLPTLARIIRCVFQEGAKLYPQIYLDECFYEL